MRIEIRTYNKKLNLKNQIESKHKKKKEKAFKKNKRCKEKKEETDIKFLFFRDVSTISNFIRFAHKILNCGCM